jgi:hypothetical protein
MACSRNPEVTRSDHCRIVDIFLLHEKVIETTIKLSETGAAVHVGQLDLNIRQRTGVWFCGQMLVISTRSTRSVLLHHLMQRRQPAV